MIMSQISLSTRKTTLKLSCLELLWLINSELNVGQNYHQAPTISPPPWTLQGQWLPPLGLLAALQKASLFCDHLKSPLSHKMTVVDSQSYSVTLIESDLFSLLPSAVQSFVPISSPDKLWFFFPQSPCNSSRILPKTLSYSECIISIFVPT